MARVFFITGIVLLLPGACTLVVSEPTEEDVGEAFRPVARIGLDSFKSGTPVRLFFRVPATAQWARIRKAWGDYGYIAFCATEKEGGRWVIPFSSLHLDLTVTRAGENVSLERAQYAPYAYSSGGDVGLSFKPRPGDELEITITARQPEVLPEGHLIIQPSWDTYAKDHIVGAMLESELRPYVRGTAALGIVLLIANSAIAIAATRRPAP